jgi:hypothetical protein
MNEHVANTDGIRLSWVWIMEILLSEIDAGKFEHPYTWDTYRHDDGRTETALYLRGCFLINCSGESSCKDTRFSEPHPSNGGPI